MELAYDSAWVTSEEARPLSLSLPMNLDGVPIKGETVGFFFDNLLPDSQAMRQRIRARFHTRGGSAFDLLEAIGRDCVGALQLLPDGETPIGTKTIAVTPLTNREVEALLFASTSPAATSIDEEDELRISIAGAQEKTALTWHEGRWCKPHGATPTTHILKLPLGLIGGRRMDMRTSLENEWLCAELLRTYGMRVASCDVASFGETRALVVARFDRALHSSRRYWLRLPQEDFCQATGTPGSTKYEADGGPGLIEIARLLHGSEARDEDLSSLLRMQLLFWMLAATDGHAKNLSLRLLPQGRYRMTPLYDVLSAWTIAGPGANQVHAKKLKLAMSLRDTHKHYRLVDIDRRHFNATARLCGLGPDMNAIIDDIVEKTPRVIDDVGGRLPKGFPARVFETITKGLRKGASL
jgi:serine/threonine-protein kinase HipA